LDLKPESPLPGYDEEEDSIFRKRRQFDEEFEVKMAMEELKEDEDSSRAGRGVRSLSESKRNLLFER